MCDTILPPHGFYVVRIDLFAEPSMPAVSSDVLEEMDLDETIRRLLEQMEHMSAEEMQDQVFRRFEYAVCALCHKELLSNPLGRPRGSRTGDN